ncbi:hypothetical protein ACTFIY_011462 [Dictyostelium cf. discoideum]
MNSITLNNNYPRLCAVFTARDAEWDRTRKNIEKQLRQEMRCTDHRESINRTAAIKKSLEKFSQIWNSPLMTINIPDHLALLVELLQLKNICSDDSISPHYINFIE